MKKYKKPGFTQINRWWTLTEGTKENLYIIALAPYGFSISCLDVYAKKAWNPGLSMKTLLSCGFSSR